MVKFFESKDYKKWNWVSDTNKFVGFDASRACCEDFGYYYTNKIKGKELKSYYKKIHKKLEKGENNFELGEVIIIEEENGCELYNRAFVELIDNNIKKLVCYIALYNNHNGWYAHSLYYRTINKRKKEAFL